MKLLVASVLTLSVLSSGSVVQYPKDGTFELLILHNNDMHARFEQTSQLSGTCTTADRDAGKCYGGFPRVAHVVKEARRAAKSGEGPPVLYLNAGDTYTGTAWFTLYKSKIAIEFVNALQPDAVSLGNHEFDEGVVGLLPFITNLSAPVLAANLKLGDVPEMEGLKNLFNSTVITINNVKIGIIGYLTPETKVLAPKNKVEYEDEIIALKREVAKLKQQGINILIALGHSGYVKDLEIAKKVEDLDLVIGGHSNTFLWNGDKLLETPEIPEGHYPKEVIQNNGRKVWVVQAYAYTKYLGQLHIVFNADGEIVKCEGDPLLLDHKIPRDPELQAIVEKYDKSVNKVYDEVVGSSEVLLDATQCRLRECNIGDLIADAMVNYTHEFHRDLYPGANIAIVQGGRIRASISHPGQPFPMTRGDWMTVLPFSDSLSIVTMNGIILKQSLEHSVSTWRTVDSTGQFQQFAGMEVIYDLAKPVGSRVVEAKAICSNCGEKGLVEIKDQVEYQVLMPSFLAQGGDKYTMFEKLPTIDIIYNEMDCVIFYIGKYGPVNPDIDGRIKVLNEDKAAIFTDSTRLDAQTPRSEYASIGNTVSITCNVYFMLLNLVLFYSAATML